MARCKAARCFAELSDGEHYCEDHNMSTDALRAEVESLKAIARAGLQGCRDGLAYIDNESENEKVSEDIRNAFVCSAEAAIKLASSTPLDSDEELDNDPASLRRKIELLQQTIEHLKGDSEAVRLAKSIKNSEPNYGNTLQRPVHLDDWKEWKGLSDAILARSGEGGKS